MQYQLNIAIDSPGVKQILANAQYITIVKNVTANPLATGNLQVAWVAFQPFLNNQVTWVENYYMYATTTQVQSGATISMQSQTASPIQTGPLYQFSGNLFSTPGVQAAPTTYNVENMNGGSLTFGLAQQAIINGASVMAPLNATAIGNNQMGTFTPIETVSIYLSSYSNNGVVISQVASSALVVTLTSQQPVANLGFNDATNTFFQLASTSAIAFSDIALGEMELPKQQHHRQLR